MKILLLTATAASHGSPTPMTIQSLPPITIRSQPPESISKMPPEAISSMPPVTIAHVNEGPNPWLAFWGPFLIALVALIVAGVTLNRVLEQIKIANRQIGLANEQIEKSEEQINLANAQLELAKEELAAVKDDFAVAQKMYDFSQRAPNLELTIEKRLETREQHGDTVYKKITLEFRLRNSGTKVAHNVDADIYFDENDIFEVPDMMWGGQPETIHEVRCRSQRYSTRRAPIKGFTHWEWTLRIRGGVRALHLFYRLYDDEYGYPLDRWGETTVELDPLFVFED